MILTRSDLRGSGATQQNPARDVPVGGWCGISESSQLTSGIQTQSIGGASEVEVEDFHVESAPDLPIPAQDRIHWCSTRFRHFWTS